MSQKSKVTADPSMANSTQKAGYEGVPAGLSRRRRSLFVLDVGIVVLMGLLLYWGAASQFYNQFNDATRYQCYAVAFWHGTPGLAMLPKQQCAFFDASTSSALAQRLQQRHFPAVFVRLVEAQSTSQAFHALPPEYPLLTLVPFSLGLVVPQQGYWYQGAFAIWMAVVAASIYFMLQRYRSRPAAIAFAAYLVIGSWATAEGRFDLVPAALTLGALLLAGKTRWTWAFFLLALATMLKFYPILLLPPLLIAQHKQSKDGWNTRSRWEAAAVFLATCIGLTAISLLLNAADTLEPFRYFFNRPIQVESFPATLIWLGTFLGYPLQYVFTYQSLNVLSPLSSAIGLLSTVCLVAGLVYTFWLQWRGKIDLYSASLLTLLIVMAAGKVLSPQYLMWAVPFVAYVGKANWKWLISWGSIAILTTLIFPFMYVDLPHIIEYYPLVVIRDFILVAIVLVLLYTASRTKVGNISLGES